jgi:hypothetical protein
MSPFRLSVCDLPEESLESAVFTRLREHFTAAAIGALNQTGSADEIAQRKPVYIWRATSTNPHLINSNEQEVRK